MTRKEILDFDMEQGHMLQALLKHCHNMKRQETRLRVATALLLAAFLATLVWIQYHQQKPDAFSGARVEALRDDGGSPKRFSAHLQPAQSMIHSCPIQPSGEQLIQWRQMSDGLDPLENFNLTDSSVLHVLTKGLYLINLRLSYRIGPKLCQRRDRPLLEVQVTQHHSNYKKERDVITAVESMACKVYWWRQSITLIKVITLEADTALRVKIDSKTCKYIDWTKNSYLEVTYL